MTVPLMFVSPSAQAEPADISYVGTKVFTPGGSTTTFTVTGVDLGTVDPSKRLFLVLNWKLYKSLPRSDVTGVTVDGVAATIHHAGDHYANLGTTDEGWRYCCIVSVPAPAVSSGTVVVTFSSAHNWPLHIGAFRAWNLLGTSPTDTGTAGGVNVQPSFTIDVEEGGIVIAGGVMGVAASVSIGSSVTQHYAQKYTGVNVAAAASFKSETGVTGKTINARDTDSDPGATGVLIAAAFR